MALYVIYYMRAFLRPSSYLLQPSLPMTLDLPMAHGSRSYPHARPSLTFPSHGAFSYLHPQILDLPIIDLP